MTSSIRSNLAVVFCAELPKSKMGTDRILVVVLVVAVGVTVDSVPSLLLSEIDSCRIRLLGFCRDCNCDCPCDCHEIALLLLLLLLALVVAGVEKAEVVDAKRHANEASCFAALGKYIILLLLGC